MTPISAMQPHAQRVVARAAPSLYGHERLGQLYKREGFARTALVSGPQGELPDPFENAAGRSLSVMTAGSLKTVDAPFCCASPSVWHQ